MTISLRSDPNDEAAQEAARKESGYTGLAPIPMWEHANMALGRTNGNLYVYSEEVLDQELNDAGIYTNEPLALTITSGAAAGMFTFTATGGVPPMAFDFGDGQAVNVDGSEAVHIYAESGTYEAVVVDTVGARATGVAGAPPSSTFSISAQQSPVLELTAEITISGSPVYDVWFDTGDGSHSSASEGDWGVIYVPYRSAGTYQVVATDSVGSVATCEAVLVDKSPSGFSIDAQPHPSLSCTVVVAVSGSPAWPISFDFGDGRVGSVTEQQYLDMGLPVVYASSGTYTITATDQAGTVAVCEAAPVELPTVPSVMFTHHDLGSCRGWLTLNGDWRLPVAFQTSDPEGDLAFVEQPDYDAYGGKIPVFFSAPGVFTVDVSEYNVSGPQKASCEAEALDRGAMPGFAPTLDVTGNGAMLTVDAAALPVFVSWGDGATNTVDSGTTVAHAYTSPGAFYPVAFDKFGTKWESTVSVAGLAADVPSGTVSDVLAWVGNDPVRAQMALDAELAGKNRVTLISELESIISGGGA